MACVFLLLIVDTRHRSHHIRTSWPSVECGRNAHVQGNSVSQIVFGLTRGLINMLVDSLTRLNISNMATRGNRADSNHSRGSEPVRSHLKSGQVLGRFRLLEWLGRGGEGDVWKAVRLEPVQELVALKILKPGLSANPARKAQFRREAERGTSLIGPSLLTVYELNEIDGYHFMAFTYVEATPLRDVIRWRREFLTRGEFEQSHPLVTMREVDYLTSMTRALAKAASALAAVHDQRVVHRDIKPANILMENRRGEGVYLCDFGLGRDLDVATSQQMRDGAGTPLYMAPSDFSGSPPMRSSVTSIRWVSLSARR